MYNILMGSQSPMTYMNCIRNVNIAKSVVERLLKKKQEDSMRENHKK